jgi:transcriptional regulator with XRE-family HTH domain
VRIGSILKKWRAVADLDQHVVAKMIGIGETTLRRIEQGRVPDGETLIKLMGWLFESEISKEALNETKQDAEGPAGEKHLPAGAIDSADAG